jgi:uncharacterized protein with GYD domain
MPHYLVQFSYTPEAWAALVRRPENRFEVFRAYVEQLGGRLLAAYYCFGEYDGMILFEAPDQARSAAATVAAVAAGHLKAVKTTVLLPVEETLEALRLAGGQPYRAPDPSAVRAEDQALAEARAEAHRRAEPDPVTQSDAESFPASDPPSWIPEHA